MTAWNMHMRRFCLVLGNVTVHFMYPLDWAMLCLDIWSNIMLDVSVRAFLGEINI